MLLQIKEARTSVLAPYTRPSEYANQGKRVVTGQRIVQAQSDLFLGWTEQNVVVAEFMKVVKVKVTDANRKKAGETGLDPS